MGRADMQKDMRQILELLQQGSTASSRSLSPLFPPQLAERTHSRVDNSQDGRSLSRPYMQMTSVDDSGYIPEQTTAFSHVLNHNWIRDDVVNSPSHSGWPSTESAIICSA